MNYAATSLTCTERGQAAVAVVLVGQAMAERVLTCDGAAGRIEHVARGMALRIMVGDQAAQRVIGEALDRAVGMRHRHHAVAAVDALVLVVGDAVQRIGDAQQVAAGEIQSVVKER